MMADADPASASAAPESTDVRSVLWSLHISAGALVGTHHGRATPRHFGEPELEYEAAVESAAVVDRSHRGRIVLTGRAPATMLTGVMTNSVPPAPTEVVTGISRGSGAYGAVLTPKGRMVTDLRVFWRGPDEQSHGLWLDVPAAGQDALLAHLHKYVPPRFAAIEDVTGETGTITAVGPHAAGMLAVRLNAAGLDSDALEGLEEDGCLLVGQPPGAILVARTSDLRVPAFDVLGNAAPVRDLWIGMVDEGATRAGLGIWETLRLEAGRPAFGSDMDDGTIPIEAGIQDRAIDHGKGCYTGQEVIVRIRDRGHVNRLLRGLLLGGAPTPPAGTPLYVDGRDKPAGHVTSGARSPAFGQGIALAYVRREVEPPAAMRLGSSDGVVVAVRAVGPGGWEMEPGDRPPTPTGAPRSGARDASRSR